MKELIYTIICYSLAQIGAWLMHNLQFKYPMLQDKHLLISLMSVPIGYVFIKGSLYSYRYFEEVWAGRLVGFGIGIIIFAFMTYFMLDEGITMKTALSVILAMTILGIQIWG